MPEILLSAHLSEKDLVQHQQTQPGRVGQEMSEFDPSLEEAMRQEVLANIVIPDVPVERLPEIVLLAGACRTDTGALATVYALAQDVHGAHIQPLKTNRRSLYSRRITGKDIVYERRILQITPSPGTELIKETIGPTTQAEKFIPLQPLVDSGYPLHKIRAVVGTFKDPLVVYDSSVKMWDENYVRPDNINECFALTWQMLSQARELGILGIPYVSETLRDSGPHRVMQQLLTATGVKYQPHVVDWDNGHGYEKDVVHYEVPPGRFILGSVSKAQGGRGGLRWAEHRMVLPEEKLEAARPQLAPAYEIYDLALAKSIQTLNL